MSRLKVEAMYVFKTASPNLTADLERRVREIAEENAMTFSELVREALRCYVIGYDRRLEPKTKQARAA